jgi:DNA-directed RNA polymerase alpha subunit
LREIGQVVTKSEEELFEKKGFNKEILADLKNVLGTQGLSVNMKNAGYIQRNMI